MTLIPAKLNFVVWQGATFREVLTLYTGDDPDVDPPLNLTGYTALLEVRSAPRDVTPIFTLSTSNGRIQLGGTAGTLSLYISASDTAAMTWLAGVYDLMVTAPNGDTDAWLTGKFSVKGV